MSRRAEKKNDRTILQEVTALSASNYASQGILMLRGFIIAHVLGPSLYGLWSLLRACFSSGIVLGLGSTSAMLRQVPWNEGRGRSDENPILKQSCLTWLILVSGLIPPTVFVLTLTGHISSYQVELRLASLVFVLYMIRMFVSSKLTSERNIILLSKMNIVYAVLNGVFGISLVFIWEINGLLIGMVLAMVIMFLHLIRRNHLSLRLTLDLPVLFRLMTIGFPILILSMTFLLIQNVDKLIVFFMLGTVHAGYFGLASFMTELIAHIPGALSVVLLPRIMRRLGQDNDRKQVEKYFTKPIWTLSCFMPVLLGLIHINLDIPIVYLLPEYLPSVEILRIFVLGLFFFSIWGLARNLLVSFDKQSQLLMAVLCFLALGAIVDITVIKMGFGINGVAIASLVVFSLITVGANTYVLLCLKKSGREILVFLVKINSPFFYMLLGLSITRHLSKGEDFIISALVQSALFVVYSLPLLFLARNENSALTRRIFKLPSS